ncbi:hypothetical protein K438DRAFT_2027960 [Mycena galopus ATCC 62051]|nr:hypothetical protein K438DRAFT_2027960 [Mycena galopus ATCC 62051]
MESGDLEGGRGSGDLALESGRSPKIERSPPSLYKDEHKGREELAEPSDSPLIPSVMALSRPVAEPMLLRDSGQGPFGPREQIQYLRHQQTRPPPMPVSPLNTTGPIAAVEDLIARQWADWEQRRPLQVRPTFSVAPHAEYFGRRELSNGQIVHRSLSTNVLRVFPADESGLPYTLACHEFTVHLAAPTNPSDVWRLECPYPTDERLQEAVGGMVPQGVDLGFELAFPTHTTSIAPDMLPLMERLRLNQTSSEDDADVDTMYGRQITAVAPRDTVVRSSTVAVTGRRTSGYGVNTREHRLTELETWSEDLFGSESESLPELVSEPETVDLGICPFCLGEEHTIVFDCPRYVPRLSEGEIIAVQALNSLASEDPTDLPELSPEVRRALDGTRGPLQVEWAAPAALRPHETAMVREMLESFTTEYDGERAMRDALSEQTLARELEEGLRQVTSTAVDRARAETPFPHVPAAVIPTADRTNEPSHTARLDPPAFYRNGQVIDRELWSSSSPSHSSSDTSSGFFDIVNSAALPSQTDAGNRIRTLSPGEWSPAVTEWSVETPDFMFNPTWVIDVAVARALHASVAEPPATASSAASSTDATSSSNEDTDPGFYAPYHRLPRFTFQPGNPEDTQLALYFWMYDGALKQLDARRFEDDFGSEPAEKALRILHGPLRRLVDYAAMAAGGGRDLPDSASHPLPPILEQSVASDDSVGPDQSPTSLDLSLPTHSPTTPSTLPPLVAFAGYVPIEDNHSAEPIEPDLEPDGDATRIGVGIELRHLPDGVSSPAMDRKRKNPDGDTDGEFQQGRRQRVFGKFRGDDLRRNTIEREAFKATATRAMVTASPEDIRYFGGIRLAILAMLHFLEEICWRLYGIDERSFPDKFLQHPLLHDIEAAKVQALWSVLQRQGRERLANNLHELLSIRIRSDIINAHLFDAKHLDESYPEQDARYWDLLREPYTEPIARAEFATRMGFDDTDSESSDDEEMRLGYPGGDSPGSDDEADMPARQWIQAAPNYYPRGPPYAVRSGPLVADRGSVPHSL